MTAIELLLTYPFVRALAVALIHFVWQGAVVALLLALALTALRRSSPNARYAVACSGLMVLLVLPAATMLVLMGGAPSADWAAAAVAPPAESEALIGAAPKADVAVEAALANTSSRSAKSTSLFAQVRQQAREPLESALPWLTLIWMLGVFTLSARSLGGWAYTASLRNRGTRSAPDEWVAVLERAANGMQRRVKLLLSERVDVPVAIGWLRPVILFPISAVSGLTLEQVESILHHELAHIRRHDHLVALLQIVTETLLFYHPAVWWISSRIRTEREHCCDDAAVAAAGDRFVYALALAELEGLRSLSPAGALAATDGPLLRRIRRVLGKGRCIDEREGWVPALTVAITTIALALALTSASTAGTAESVDPRVGAASRVAANPSAPSAAQEAVYRAPDFSQPLSSRWDWAMDELERLELRGSYWIAWGIRRPGLEHEWIMSNAGGGPRDGTTILKRLLDHEGDVIFLFGFGPGARQPGDLRFMRMRSRNQPVELSGRPIFWLGDANDRESLSQLQVLYEATDRTELRSELGAALSLHTDETIALPAVSEVLSESESDEVRAETAAWLGNQQSAEAVELLARLAMQDESARVRDEAVTGLAGMDTPEATAALLQLARNTRHEDVRNEAVQYLGRRGYDEAVSILLQIAKDDADRGIRLEAVDALANIESEAAFRALVDLLRSAGDDVVRNESVQYLGRARFDEAIPVLEELVNNDPDAAVQMEAVDALANIGSEAAFRSLMKIAETHPDWDIRSEAAQHVARRWRR